MSAEHANCSVTNHFHLSASNGADFSKAFHMAETTKVARWGLTLLPCAKLAVVFGVLIKTEQSGLGD